MAFSPIGLNLAERQFRSYWERTSEVGNTNERIRFKVVLDLMQAEATFARPHTPKGHPKKIIERFAITSGIRCR